VRGPSSAKLVAATVAGCACLAVASPLAAANSNGATAPGPMETSQATINPDGTAAAPADAPPEVVAAIEAANEIEDMPYEYGGGHGDFEDKGYDCSGAVSYALHAAGMLDSPLDSSGLMKWGDRGRGSWITVYSNPGHAYAVIAGLRWDTSMTPGNGPGWSEQKRPAKGFKKRNWNGL
jgi:cell wall-associated NlpC family hydrolase